MSVSMIDGHDDAVKQGDLISRIALIAELSKGTIIPDDCYIAGIMAGVKYAMEKAENAPAVDAVVVVRCKDCKHYAEAKGIDSGKPCGYGKCCCAVGIRGVVYDDDFCSCGERRDGE